MPRKFEVMHLARSIVEYMDAYPYNWNQEQLQGLSTFAKWLARREHELYVRTKETDGEKILPIEEARLLLKSFMEMFFGGAIPCKLVYKALSRGVLGTAGPDSLFHLHDITISLDVGASKMSKNEQGAYTLLDFIGVLLHEAVHAFIQQYACTHCKSFKAADTARGHGRAFQIIAAKIEQVCIRILGLPVDLMRCEALLYHWDVLSKKLPSRHDLQTWRLVTPKEFVAGRDYFAERFAENPMRMLDQIDEVLEEFDCWRRARGDRSKAVLFHSEGTYGES
jgi:hypothetical protein